MVPCFHTAMLGRRRGSVSKWFANGQSDVLSFFPAAAEEIYLPGKFADGQSIVGEVAGNVLAPVTSPYWQQPLTGAAGDPLGVRFDIGGLDSFDAANAAVHNYTGSFAILCAVKFGTLTSGYFGVHGKREPPSPYPGYELSLTNTTLYAVYDDGPSVVRTLSIAHGFASELAYLFVGISEAANICVLNTSAGTATPQTPPSTTSNTALFAIGSQRVGASAVTVGPTIIWSGANAEAVIASRATTLPAWWAA